MLPDGDIRRDDPEDELPSQLLNIDLLKARVSLLGDQMLGQLFKGGQLPRDLGFVHFAIGVRLFSIKTLFRPSQSNAA